MAAINFKPEFASAVEAGTKLQTILRETDLEVGDICQLATVRDWWGDIQYVKELGEGIIESVEAITIFNYSDILIDRTMLSVCEVSFFTRDEGFEYLEDFFYFFENQYGLPFDGVLIKWRLK